MKLYVPKFLANKNIAIEIANGTDENGSLNIVKEVNALCRFEQNSSVTYTKEGEKITLKGKAFIFEKFDEFDDEVSGFCTINGIKYDIANSSKKYNPDGSVNHIVLELI